MKWEYALFMLSFILEGASLAILIDIWSNCSGINTIIGSGGGSEEMNNLKFLCVFGFFVIYSKNPSKPLRPYSQLYMRCKF